LKALRQRVSGLVILPLAFALVARSQPAQADFEQLSRRASEALDTKPEEAAKLYREALSLRPDWAEGWFYLGTSFFQLHDYRAAVEALRKASGLAPKKGTPLAFLGMAEYELGNYKQALPDILKSEATGLADDPAFVAAVHYRAALVCLRFSDFVQALEQLRPLVKAGNRSDLVVEALGLCVLNISSTPEQLAPPRRPFIDAAGKAAWAFVAERPDESGPLFEALVAQFPSEPGVHYMNGVFLIDHDPDAAEKEFRTELRIAPANVQARVQIALLLIKRGETEAAIKMAGEAAQLQPTNALCHATAGRALLSAGRIKEAITALERAKKLAPDASLTHFYLAQAYRRAGRPADAQKEKAEWERTRSRQEPEVVPTP